MQLKFAEVSILLAASLACGAPHLHAQASSSPEQGDSIPNPEASQAGREDRESVIGQVESLNERLESKGVAYDLLYASDSLSNVRSVQPDRFTSYSRVRGTVDVDFSKLTQTPGLSVHLTAAWQTGASLGAYLGTEISPSAFASFNVFRLDAWWVEKRFASERIAVRAGQFAGEDTYGSQRLGSSFVFQPMAYAFGNLFNTYEPYILLGSPALELRVVPRKHMYVKSAVMAGDRVPQAHNPTGFVPQFRGAPVTVSEIGWTPGLDASGIRPPDNRTTRHGYTGAYLFGGSFNPGKFATAASTAPASGNFLVYGSASQALWRPTHTSGRGFDATAGFTWSPPDRNFNNRELTLGLRFNEPFASESHYNTVAFGYVRSGFSTQTLPNQPVPPAHAENALELNMLILLNKAIFVQPVVQQFIDTGGGVRTATVIGFRSRVNF